jgi:hypothetical protein
MGHVSTVQRRPEIDLAAPPMYIETQGHSHTMDTKTRIASAILYFMVGVLAFMGLAYTFAPTIMPYHEQYIGMQHEQLEPRVAALMLFFMKDMGVNFLALAVALGLLVRIPFRRGEPWARWAIGAVALTAFLPLLWITLSIGLHTPWWLVSIGIVAVTVALLISGSPARGR